MSALSLQCDKVPVYVLAGSMAQIPPHISITLFQVLSQSISEHKDSFDLKGQRETSGISLVSTENSLTTLFCFNGVIKLNVVIKFRLTSRCCQISGTMTTAYPINSSLSQGVEFMALFWCWKWGESKQAAHSFL